MSASSQENHSTTVFEDAWMQSGGHIFKSEKHGVMARPDLFPKFNLQVVVTPRNGSPGNLVRFSDLPRSTRLKLHMVADEVEEQIAEHCGPDQRVITHVEGFSVGDHPHVVLFRAERREGERLYTGSPLGPLAVQNTLEVITFTPVKAQLLEARLDEIQC
ncbi:MAG TPA: hypothetical protein VNX65_04795 [Patescibacteria group bacterium]|jgi:hypothetical protein|nr:hypothetical protein [Patescibacteria group bacterium]